MASESIGWLGVVVMACVCGGLLSSCAEHRFRLITVIRVGRLGRSMSR